MSLRLRWSTGALLAAVITLAAPLSVRAADGAFTLEAPAVASLTEGQSLWSRPGALPAAAIYLASGVHLLGGLRLRSGILPRGADEGTHGFVSLGLAGRIRPWVPEAAETRTEGPWVELAGGVHLTSGQARPTAEAGMGWGFSIGGATLGPCLRYVEVVQASGTPHTRLGLLGLEMGFSTRAPPPPRPLPPPVAVRTPPRRLVPVGDRDKDGISDLDDKCPLEPEDRDGFQDEDGCPDPDNDGDRIADAVDKCPNEPEVVNGVDDQDGCPDQGVVEVVNNRIVLDATVLFDQDRARVRTAARPHLQAILELWKQHPEWLKMIIEGHTDTRGPDRYNDWLSTERATRVRKALIGMGVAPERLETKGVGRAHPLDASGTPEAHRRNRRVEFVIIGGPAPATAITP
jgi:outer membrane protein OmpA-like peptidoglycan-associated protein